MSGEAIRLSIDDMNWQTLAPSAAPLQVGGGKQRFLWNYRNRIPDFTGTYIEPFAGGLSVYFHVASRSPVPVQANLSDINLRLIRTYQAVKHNWPEVSEHLKHLAAAYNESRDRSAFYTQIRQEHNRISPASDPARFIFLMVAGWNGVFRVNQKGEFNVPHGSKGERDINFPDDSHLRAVAAVFQHASIRAESWESAISAAKMGDFLFLNPPYFQDSESRRDLYERARQFELKDHERLARTLAGLQNSGVDFLLTNAASRTMIDLYNSYSLSVEKIAMHRSISTNAETRGTDYSCW